ncbi:MAG: ribulose-phosphate 3-epimerase [Janthinobacterium lividum]
MIKIAPSILSADFSNLEREIKNLELAGADMIHIDVMDGHFVPNLTLGPPVIDALRKHTKLPFDVHLMINKPEDSIKSYINAGADIITIHPETTTHLDRILSQIRILGAKTGVSLLPTTCENVLNYCYDKIDLILVMSVNPGFGGQELISSQLIKVRKIRKNIEALERKIVLAIDGGVNLSNARDCKDAGADLLVAGSSIFSGGEYKKNIDALKEVTR